MATRADTIVAAIERTSLRTPRLGGAPARGAILRGAIRGSALALVALATITTAVAAQADSGWRFIESPFADLWTHGLAVVGYHGFGPLPLYDPEYRGLVYDDRSGPPTALDRERGALLGSMVRDDAFEILHFVPLYLFDAPREEGLAALESLGTAPTGTTPTLRPEVALGQAAVSAVLTRRDQRRFLAHFAGLVRDEAPVVDRLRDDGDRQRAGVLRTIADRWSAELRPALSDFLEREHNEGGVIVVTRSIGAEGRFMHHPDHGAVVAIGLASGDPPEEALAALVRELCYPAVRRALDPFEAALGDRRDASRASDLAATRCGELLLEARAPALLPAYRSRFDLPPGGVGSAFLSSSGVTPGVAALEASLDRALHRELHLNHHTERPQAARGEES